jgi:folylpolyglutamate synthase/dihydropteroate synthase
VVYRTAAERGAPVVEAVRDASVDGELVDGAADVSIRTPHADYGRVRLGLRGRHQVPNALVAVRLLELFQLDHGRTVLLDAAHNIDGATALVEYIRAWHSRPLLVLGVMHDKDVEAMLRILLPAVAGVIATAAPSPRATPAADLARRASAVATSLALVGADGRTPLPVTAVADPNEAVSRAIGASDLVCVAGSVFLAGAVRDGLRQRVILR